MSLTGESVRPDDLFDRDREWAELTRFASQSTSGLRLGIVSGRRRQGKSYLLRRLTRTHTGLYHQAQELERPQALARFAGDVAETLGLPRDQLQFADWETALRTALGYPARGNGDPRPAAPAGPARLLVLDELPYLLAHSPEIPSVLQELHDEARDHELPPAGIIVCGSALSVMTDLLSGTRPMRGRAQLNMTIQPFDYRTAAQYWNITDPEMAFAVHTVLGGTAGYKPLTDTAALPDDVADLPTWLAGNVLNPAHALFHEKDYLLREDTRIADKQVYNSILATIAAGNHTPKAIGGPTGRDSNQLRHPLNTLVATGFINRVDDVLATRKPLYFLADPIIAFTEVVIDPYRPFLEEGDVATAWHEADPAYRSRILGPHFEHLAREWTRRYSADRWGGQTLGMVGPAVVNDPAGRAQHEIDVVGLERGTRSGADGARIVVLGEAKATNRPRGAADLARLVHIRHLLDSRGFNVSSTHLAIFSRVGFDADLQGQAANSSDVHLITLSAMYND